MSYKCICGHEDNRHANIDDGSITGIWGAGECELCRRKRFEDQQPPACPSCGHLMSEHNTPLSHCLHERCGCTLTPASQEQQEKQCRCGHFKEQPKPEMLQPVLQMPLECDRRGCSKGCGGSSCVKAQRDADMAWHNDYCNKCQTSQLVTPSWLSAHDAAIRAQAVKEFAEKIPYKLRKVEGLDGDPINKRASSWQWVIEKDELEAYIKSMGGIDV